MHGHAAHGSGMVLRHPPKQKKTSLLLKDLALVQGRRQKLGVFDGVVPIGAHATNAEITRQLHTHLAESTELGK